MEKSAISFHRVAFECHVDTPANVAAVHLQRYFTADSAIGAGEALSFITGT